MMLTNIVYIMGQPLIKRHESANMESPSGSNSHQFVMEFFYTRGLYIPTKYNYTPSILPCVDLTLAKTLFNFIWKLHFGTNKMKIEHHVQYAQQCDGECIPLQYI